MVVVAVLSGLHTLIALPENEKQAQKQIWIVNTY